MLIEIHALPVTTNNPQRVENKHPKCNHEKQTRIRNEFTKTTGAVYNRCIKYQITLLGILLETRAQLFIQQVQLAYQLNRCSVCTKPVFYAL